MFVVDEILNLCCKRFKKFPEFVSDKIIDSSPILSELLGWDRPDIQFELSLILQDVVCRRFYDAGADGLKKGFTIVVVNLELNELLEMSGGKTLDAGEWFCVTRRRRVA
jgi:hypothetical protein